VSCDQIRKFNFPILLLNGEQSPKRYALMFAAMRNCVSVPVDAPIIIPGASHPMNRQNPQYFDAAVLGFLSGR
jgi:pimeloyl-ACP methyl ester carboxylesterase